MGRDKLKRTLQFKPIYKEFYSKNGSDQTIHLLNEEMEALYLIDSKELYQADAAKAMGVSRATFANIIKKARQKITMMLITGSNLKIEDDNHNCIIMIASDDKVEIVNSSMRSKYFHIYKVEDKIIIDKIIIENILFSNKLKPAQEIPKIALQYNINFFLAGNVGDGLKSSLLSKGIYTYKIDNNISLKKICDIVAI
jgi:predicted DNA-binding protein (UPF0251 family)